MYKIKLIILIAFYLLFYATPLYAYLDPGTFSYLISILVGAIVGILMYIKIIWTKVKLLISKLKYRKKDVDPL